MWMRLYEVPENDLFAHDDNLYRFIRFESEMVNGGHVVGEDQKIVCLNQETKKEELINCNAFVRRLDQLEDGTEEYVVAIGLETDELKPRYKSLDEAIKRSLEYREEKHVFVSIWIASEYDDEEAALYGPIWTGENSNNQVVGWSF